MKTVQILKYYDASLSHLAEAQSQYLCKYDLLQLDLSITCAEKI